LRCACTMGAVRWVGKASSVVFQQLRLGSLFLRFNDEILNERYSTVIYTICGEIGQYEV